MRRVGAKMVGAVLVHAALNFSCGSAAQTQAVEDAVTVSKAAADNRLDSVPPAFRLDIDFATARAEIDALERFRSGESAAALDFPPTSQVDFSARPLPVVRRDQCQEVRRVDDNLEKAAICGWAVGANGTPASTDQPYQCRGSQQCARLPIEGSDGSRGIAECRLIGHLPTDCFPLVLELEGASLHRVVAYWHRRATDSVRHVPTPEPIWLDVGHGDQDAVAKKVAAVLSEEHGFEVSLDRGKSEWRIVANAADRDSPFLAPLREQARLDLRVAREEDEQTSAVSLSVLVYVRAASDRNAPWRPLDTDERSRYVDTLQASLERALEELCGACVDAERTAINWH